MLTFSVSLQSNSCKSVVPCMRRLHQFLSALALGLELIKLMQAWYNYKCKIKIVAVTIAKEFYWRGIAEPICQINVTWHQSCRH